MMEEGNAGEEAMFQIVESFIHKILSMRSKKEQ